MQCNTRENIKKQKLERLGLEKLNKQGSLMKIVAYEEYLNGRITKECFDAMNNYIVEITD